jgi:hypothetical protein
MRRWLLGLRAEETGYTQRGFQGATEAMQARLEQVGGTFLDGYHLALEHETPVAVVAELNRVPLELRGFAFEGAAMGLGLLESLTPWRSDRVNQFLSIAGDAHAYMIHVGVGWVWARFSWRRRATEQQLDPLLRWLAYDGWGFHEGFFHWPQYTAGRPAPPSLSGYERRVFDQGLGRSFWFVKGGNPELIARSINNLDALRRADLWSGVGLSSSYAGMVPEDDLHQLRELAGEYWPQLAQGSAFAAKARQRAGNLTDYTHLATRILCGMSALDAARLCDTTLEHLPTDTTEPGYEIWRQRLQQKFQHLHPQQRQHLLQEV